MFRFTFAGFASSFRKNVCWLALIIALPASSLVAASDRVRVFVLTDIENEPDDAMSMVRFLVYSNEWDVAGLVATTSVHQQHQTAAWRIREIVSAYGKVRDNLALHDPRYPTADKLLSVISEGRPDYGMHAVGEGMDSAGSEALIAAVDQPDERPLWVTVWGGANVLAQALWKVQHTRAPDQVERFAGKLRVYTISDQDDSGPWIRKTFPGVFYIVSPGYHAAGAYHYATWSGISGDNFHGRFSGGDFSHVAPAWLDENIRKKGPLGAQYPHVEYLMEGDTPTFLGLIPNGLNVPERPDWGGWGGRYELYVPKTEKWFFEPETRPIWTNVPDEVLGADGRWHTDNHATIWRWRAAFQNDFAARMDWTVKAPAEANHPPVPKLAGPAEISVKAGDRVELDASGSTDPDNHELSYQWFYYPEAGTGALESGRTGEFLKINDAQTAHAWFTAPKNRRPGPGAYTYHVILAVTDHGAPALTRYQRVIVTVQ